LLEISNDAGGRWHPSQGLIAFRAVSIGFALLVWADTLSTGDGTTGEYKEGTPAAGSALPRQEGLSSDRPGLQGMMCSVEQDYSADGIALRVIHSGRRRQSLRRSTRADARIIQAQFATWMSQRIDRRIRPRSGRRVRVTPLTRRAGRVQGQHEQPGRRRTAEPHRSFTKVGAKLFIVD